MAFSGHALFVRSERKKAKIKEKGKSTMAWEKEERRKRRKRGFTI